MIRDPPYFHLFYLFSRLPDKNHLSCHSLFRTCLQFVPHKSILYLIILYRSTIQLSTPPDPPLLKTLYSGPDLKFFRDLIKIQKLPTQIWHQLPFNDHLKFFPSFFKSTQKLLRPSYLRHNHHQQSPPTTRTFVLLINPSVTEDIVNRKRRTVWWSFESRISFLINKSSVKTYNR